MTNETLGAVLGSAIASAGLVIAGARRWMNPSARKLDAMSAELGVGSQNGQSMSSLMQSTALAVQCMAEMTERNGRGITEILDVQRLHGQRITVLETKHEALHQRQEQTAKTEDIAALLATRTKTMNAKLMAAIKRISTQPARKAKAR